MRVQVPQPGSQYQPPNIAPRGAYETTEWPSARSEGQRPGEPEGIPWLRYLDVIKRHSLLIIGLAALGSAIGFFLATRIRPLYDVHATVWINTERPGGTLTGPIRVQRHIPSTSWVELLRSYALVDPVVERLRLNVAYNVLSDSVLFRSFESLPTLRRGSYTLNVDAAGRTYTLSNARDSVLERGSVGDTIGRSFGFVWLPDGQLLTPRRVVSFLLETPRTTSEKLVASMRP